jgi:hypothetical protein
LQRVLVAVVIAALGYYGHRFWWFTTEPRSNPICDIDWRYNTHFLSTEPLMIYIHNFTSPAESEYLAGLP